jgi:hypothetical protein
VAVRKKVVLLESDIDSKALTAAEIQASFKSSARETGAAGKLAALTKLAEKI